MECGHKQLSLTCRNNASVNRRQYFRVTPYLRDIRRADKDFFDLADAVENRFCAETAELSAVGIPFGFYVHGVKVYRAVAEGKRRASADTSAEDEIIAGIEAAIHERETT